MRVNSKTVWEFVPRKKEIPRERERERERENQKSYEVKTEEKE